MGTRIPLSFLRPRERERERERVNNRAKLRTFNLLIFRKVTPRGPHSKIKN
jgi:hypothetical protein